jgi:cellulose synthase/poly-beta-1,6-N-acetylglucosamine synthase-like glycosyltransferase
MSQLVSNKATICIVNYKTLDFTRLCLRSIRKFTNYPYEMIVVDNGSNDDSVEYLRSLKWIRLIERPRQSDQPQGSFDHASALDLGLADCNTEFFVAMHSDTFVKKLGWLAELISFFADNPKIACVGSGKIELTPTWIELVKRFTDVKSFMRGLFGTPAQHAKYRYHNRAICCLYRTEVLRREGLSFLMGQDQGLTAGQKLYFELVDRGYKTVELPPSIMGQYIIHLAHATQALNPREFKLRDKTHRKFNRTIDKVMSSAIIQDILADEPLDR